VLLECNFIFTVIVWVVDDLLCDQNWLAFVLENTHDLEFKARQNRFGSRRHELLLFAFEVQDEILLLSLQN
jgi:hypothetical protein